MTRPLSPAHKAAIREELAGIIIKAQTRSPHPDAVITWPMARAIVSALIASDDAPEWDMVIASRDTLHTLIAGYLR